MPPGWTPSVRTNRDRLAYERHRVVLGENNHATLISATNYGRDLREAGRYQQSVNLLREVHASYASLLGPEERLTLGAEANLAVSLRVDGNPREAARLPPHPAFEPSFASSLTRTAGKSLSMSTMSPSGSHG